jgi:hypothetical protein
MSNVYRAGDTVRLEAQTPLDNRAAYAVGYRVTHPSGRTIAYLVPAHEHLDIVLDQSGWWQVEISGPDGIPQDAQTIEVKP